MIRLRLTLLITLFALLLPGAALAAPLKVVTSFSILGDMVLQVAGNRVQIKTLVGPDKDAHHYEPTPSDVRALSEADLFVVNGLGFEGWMDRLVEASGFDGKIVVASYGVRALKAPEPDPNDHPQAHSKKHAPTAFDPHAWQSLPNGVIYVQNIRDALTKADKANGATYRGNAMLFIKEMTYLDKIVKKQMKNLPDYKRKVITSHDAFQYFGKTYGVTFLSPVGQNTEDEPSARDVAALINQVRSEHVRALFLENISRAGVLDQLRREGAFVMGGTLYSDALSGPNGPAASYLNLFRHNVELLLEGMRNNPDR